MLITGWCHSSLQSDESEEHSFNDGTDKIPMTDKVFFAETVGKTEVKLESFKIKISWAQWEEIWLFGSVSPIEF